MSDAHDQIRNLLHRYSEAFDEGRFDILDEIFEHATIRIALGDNEPDSGLPGRSLSTRTGGVILYADGTPRTRHIVTNTIIDVEEVPGRATARSYNTTLQQAPGHDLQIIATARYYDTFERVDGKWRFTERIVRQSSMNGTDRDFIGDMSHHSRGKRPPTSTA